MKLKELLNIVDPDVFVSIIEMESDGDEFILFRGAIDSVPWIYVDMPLDTTHGTPSIYIDKDENGESIMIIFVKEEEEKL